MPVGNALKPVSIKRECIMCDDMMHFYLCQSSLNLKSMHYKPHEIKYGDGSVITIWVHYSWQLDHIGLDVVKRTLEPHLRRIERDHCCFVDLERETVIFEL